MPSLTVHCSICGKAVSGYNFEERMSKLRRHRKNYHPSAHRRSTRKMIATKRRKAGNPQRSKFRYSVPADRVGRTIACDLCKRAIEGNAFAVYQTEKGYNYYHISCWNKIVRRS
jgi:hypothetical protein